MAAGSDKWWRVVATTAIELGRTVVDEIRDLFRLATDPGSWKVLGILLLLEMPFLLILWFSFGFDNMLRISGQGGRCAYVSDAEGFVLIFGGVFSGLLSVVSLGAFANAWRYRNRPKARNAVLEYRRMSIQYAAGSAVFAVVPVVLLIRNC